MLTRRSALILAVCSAALLAAGLTEPPPAASPTPPAPIRLTIDYHDGVQKTFTNLTYTKDMSVADTLKLAKEHSHGITFESKGSGETIFITQIDDLKNQGGGKTSLNWQYLVNGKLGTVGCGAAKLQPGDTVVWEFEIYKMPAK